MGWLARRKQDGNGPPPDQEGGSSPKHTMLRSIAEEPASTSHITDQASHTDTRQQHLAATRGAVTSAESTDASPMAAPSKQGGARAFLAIGVGAGLAIAAAGAWLLRRRSGG